jgi:hypothetical protein
LQRRRLAVHQTGTDRLQPKVKNNNNIVINADTDQQLGPTSQRFLESLYAYACIRTSFLSRLHDYADDHDHDYPVPVIRT